MSRRALLLSLGLLLLAASAALVPWWRLFHRRPARVEVVAGFDWAGFNDRERDGLMMVVSDLLELGGATLVSTPPDAGAARVSRLRLQARKEGGSFHLRAEWEGAGAKSRTFDIAESDPRQGLLRLASELGFASSDGARLMPGAAEDLLPLAEGLAVTYDGTGADLNAFIPRLASLAAREADNPLAALVDSMVRYRVLLTRTPADTDRQADTRQAFQRCLGLMPDYPRACVRFSLYLTDTGGQRESLDLLFEAARAHPRSPGLQSAVAYAARTSGLLDGARSALRKQDKLLGGEGTTTGLAENSWLYLGEWSRFTQVLGPGSDEVPDPIGDFYRGYIRILLQRQAEAPPYFLRAEGAEESSPQFARLAKVFRLALDHREAEARALLADLESTRTQLRVPDGEYTFKLAEAHALLGDLPEAVEAGLRAASQGFGCTAWYESSPLLRPLQPLPRWKALVQHLRERQQLMETRFPLRRFSD